MKTPNLGAAFVLANGGKLPKESKPMKPVYYPKMASDAIVFKDRPIPPHCKIERRIVWALLAHMGKAGWLPAFVDDGGDEMVKTPSRKEAYEAVFAVDESRLYLTNGTKRHGILLVGGNGEDIISDWGFTDKDPDGFNAAMDAFLERVMEWYD